jgi:hypothetical protein
VTTSEPPFFAALKRRRFYRSLGAVLVVMAVVVAVHDLAEIDGWLLVAILTGVVVIVLGLATWWGHRREARALARVHAARPHAWVSSAAVFGLPQHVVVAVEGEHIAVIGDDGTEVASWERSEMEAVGVVGLPSHWPPRQTVVIDFFSPDVPTVLITFTGHAGLTAPPGLAAEAARVLEPR